MPPAPAVRPRHPGGEAAGVPWPEPEGPALRSNETVNDGGHKSRCRQNNGLTETWAGAILRSGEKTHVGADWLRGC